MGNFVLAAIILNGAWTQLDVIGWPAVLLPLLVLALDRHQPPSTQRSLSTLAPLNSLIPVFVAAGICAVHLVHVILTAREEFGFGGDEGYHLSATRAFALYFMKAGPLLAGVAVVFVVCRRWAASIAGAAAMCAVIASSMLLPDEPLFGRYPTGFYLLAMPLNVAFEVVRVPYPFTANHIANMLSLPAWLFLLRPAIVGRWPDWRVLPVAFLIYLQGPSIVYVGGGLLEPWAFVFVLLALETAAVPDPDRRWLPVMLAGVATLFKETAILFVPPIWLLTMVEWRGSRPSLRAEAIRAGFAAVAPFVIYYAVRRGLGIVRGYEIAGAAEVWTAARAAALLEKARFQLGVGGSISAAIVAAWAAFGFVFNRAAVRHHVVWVFTAAALVIFFAADAASIPFTGYGRFLAYSLLALCGVVFVTARWLEQERRKLLIILTVAIAALQLGPTWRVLALDLQPHYERNSLEWPDSLVRYPIRALAQRLSEVDGAGTIKTLRVIVFGTDLISLRVAYPDLAARYDLQGETQSRAQSDCSCRNDTEAIIAAFEWPAHFAETPEARLNFTRVQSSCLTQVRATCRSIAFEQRRDGAIIGALGTGVR